MDIWQLVLISLAVRVVLFFAGRFQMCFNDKISDKIIWAVYVGADWISGYALTSLSRQDYCIPLSLPFFWAPFLLNHLGGQDTITAFSMEDNKLWLRQLAYLGSYAVLIGLILRNAFRRHSTELLVSVILMCVAGIFKHLEKIWALKSGSYESLEDSSGRHHYVYNQQLQAVSVGNGSTNLPEERIPLPEPSNRDGHPAVPQGTNDGNNADSVCIALRSMLDVHDIFAANNMSEVRDQDVVKAYKMVELQLGLMHDDLYTKCLVLRTRTGLVLRIISMVCSWVAFALFYSTSGKERRYSKADIDISYSLFMGVFFLDFCGMLILMMSPWTWEWFKSHGFNSLASVSSPWTWEWFKCHGFNRLASVSWFLYSTRWPLGMGLQQRWPSSMGQCRNMHMLAGIEQPNSITSKLATKLGKLLRFFRVGEETISSWLEKFIHTEYVRLDDSILEKIVSGIGEIRGELRDPARVRREWNSLSEFLVSIHDAIEAEFGLALLMLHMYTDIHLDTVEPRDNTERSLKSVSEKLSNYMMYLMVNQPSMLPMNTCASSSRKKTRNVFADQINGGSRALDRYNNIRRKLLEDGHEQPFGEEALEELAAMWTRVLLYAAGRSPPELHAACLATGGELITVAWLLMAHQGIGNTKLGRLAFTNPSGDVETAYAIYIDEDTSSSATEEGSDEDTSRNSDEGFVLAGV